MPSIKRIAIGLIWSQDRLVVGRRSGSQVWAGYDEFPGGKCEEGETPAEAVIRESLEETGLNVRLIGCRAVVCSEIASGALELSFFDLEPIDSGESLIPPFTWWTVEEVLDGNFPPANQEVLDTLRAERLRRSR